MLALIDGDIVCYRCAAVNENAAAGIAKWQADQLLNRILEDCNADDWTIYLSGDNNFRYQLYPEYKANRKDMVKPKHLEVLREHLVLEWNGTIVDGIEADDALGIRQCTTSSDSVICSIDKDLRQISGNHYHFVNRQWSNISVDEGWRNFYYQVLTGDATDNIKGCRGYGPVKSEAALRNANPQTVDGFFLACKQAYIDTYGPELWQSELELNAKLLYIHRVEGDEWKPPGQEVETKQLSSGEMMDTSLEPTTKAVMENTTPVDGSKMDIIATS